MRPPDSLVGAALEFVPNLSFLFLILPFPEPSARCVVTGTVRPARGEDEGICTCRDDTYG
ncbi:hypothetical protein ABH15_08815 [Methanoculleus taiwanensis]|uniref:Uncharacterized protein n=1 Tax=Methanoculleus taiwanensis TaxID=1550565 RepID=A0A498H2T1_9EURY|nr:hypothetical protein [Methanoculleus taiwanensis]RXE56234.1 hypothetical protein ABH15_08815 [Methanoculleus taiwanensis]